MSTTKQGKGRFKVGDWVTLQYGAREMIAQVAEERGPLGINQRHLYRIRVPTESGEAADSFELPEDELKAVTPLRNPAIVKYLKDGGLLNILQSGLKDRNEAPRVWLTFTSRGEVSHTFIAARGIVGGAAVPFFAFHGNRIFTPKEAEVGRFLAEFGLNQGEVREILTAVGTAP